MTPHPADRLAFDRSQVAEPVWNRIETAADAVGLERSHLLHAGPPIQEPAEAVLPILHSACTASVWEGLAPSLPEAREAILSGDIELHPAQDLGVATPLAAVVSSSMPLQCVYDAHRGAVQAFSPINGGNGPAIRLGLISDNVVEHLKWLNGDFAELLGHGLAEGIPLVPLAAGSLAEGDDCHGRTPAGTRLLVEELQARSQRSWDEHSRNFMADSPSLFLNLWMAATKCIMKAAEGVDGSGLITAAGGNGRDAGIQVSGLAGRWFTAPASPPNGSVHGVPADRALGAIGDSAIVDAYGLGAMAVNLSPELQKAFEAVLPDDAALRRRQLPVGRHVGLGKLDVSLGISARAVAATGLCPLVSLGILDRLGLEGRIGGGIYEIPASAFADAVAELERKQT